MLEEMGLDREHARELRRQVLEGVILLCRWQLERLHETPAPKPRGKRARKVAVD
jgi:hypothetical protein